MKYFRCLQTDSDSEDYIKPHTFTKGYLYPIYEFPGKEFIILDNYGTEATFVQPNSYNPKALAEQFSGYWEYIEK